MHATENPAFVGDAGEPQYDRYTENNGSRVTSEVQKGEHTNHFLCGVSTQFLISQLVL